MASSRLTGLNDNVRTFGDGTRNFTSLSTFESAVDINTITAAQGESLEMYDDSSPYDQTVSFSGGTHNADYPIILYPVSGQENLGDRSTGVRFHYVTTGAAGFQCIDDFIYLHDFGIQGTIDRASAVHRVIYLRDGDVNIVGVHVYNCVNSNTGTVTGIEFNSSSDDSNLINCIFADIDDICVRVAVGAAGITIYNCTVTGSVLGIDNGNTTAPLVLTKNTISTNNTTNWSGSGHHTNSTDNFDDGTNAPGSDPHNSRTFTFASATKFLLDSADTGAKDLGADLSSDTDGYAFDDDILLNTRTGDWDGGAHEIQGGGPAPTLIRTLATLGVGV